MKATPQRAAGTWIARGAIAMLGLVAALCARAGEGLPAATGSDGLAPLPLTVSNETGAAIACGATLAHWYAADLGTAEPSGRIAIALWTDPATGEVFLLNGRGDRMPVQTLWCGLDGRSWETRATIGLDRRAGAVPKPVDLTCAALAGGHVACRQVK
ncbi:hypothetical protein SAMN02745172_02173 [Pseudoxanthobacter soli DSM 19599]|uniref:Uncharacterized protein n=1 Tax=Pseudoxanthobacter soli DSM 19599 TaxID=1123029 RepID=A0A1M7ZKW4_9HYPH|nr:hypothetical protein [Pseudoxanthobacter soli]SHO65528.1 hypothetical protein SAMN02745172_02173 [Pseudoxanthobacter soli DSM 19599]